MGNDLFAGAVKTYLDKFWEFRVPAQLAVSTTVCPFFSRPDKKHTMVRF
jgi:hypothetical protein